MSMASADPIASPAGATRADPGDSRARLTGPGGSSIKQDRDRFVAFAYATSDLMFEIDNGGLIRCIYGVAAALAKPHDGAPWVALFDLVSHDEIEARLEALAVGERAGPFPVTLTGGNTADLSLLRLVGDTVHCVLTNLQQRDQRSGLLTRDAFMEALKSDQLADAKAVTLIDVEGLEALRAEDPSGAAAAVGALGAMLRDQGLAAGRLSDHRFAVLGQVAPGEEAMRERVEGVLRQFDPEGEHLSSAAATLDAEESRNALIYTLQEFATTGTVTVDGMSRDLGAKAKQTAQEMLAFKTMVTSRQFDMHFQPIVELEGGDAHHHEVLSRFERGKSPFDIITFAERSGVIQSLDLSVVNRVIAYLNAPATAPNVRLAVNLSGYSLSNDAFLGAFFALLKDNALLASRLMFEVTESARLDDLERAGRVLGDLRGYGFQVCLDDFGAGAASFQYLRALPIDFIKIDGSYVLSMQQSAKDHALIKAMAALARDLGISTIGECVETEEQAAALRRLGISLAQGYLYGKPRPQPTEPTRGAA